MLPELVRRDSEVVYRAPILTSFVIRCTNLQILATIAPAYPRIPAISNRYRPFVSGRGYDAEVKRRFFSLKKYTVRILIVLTVVSGSDVSFRQVRR